MDLFHQVKLLSVRAMTRHARRGNKKSVLPGATQWTQLKQKNYTSLKEDDGELDYKL